ncbi:MAG: DNA double-strand break repair nuclease NurA [Candidatus Methanofastidiosia archaeon]
MELEAIVQELKKYYENKEFESFEVTSIRKSVGREVAAIDGGSVILWSNGVKSIGVMKAGYLIYDENHKIEKKFEEEKYLIFDATESYQRSRLDDERFSMELKCLEKASKRCDLLLYDGALMGFGESARKILRKIGKRASVVGISKKTRINFLQRGVPDTETLKVRGRWYFKIPDSLIDARGYRCLGEIYVTKLHDEGRAFRVDILGEKVFENLVHFSNYRLCLGYPYPLLEVHKYVSLRDKAEMFQTKLREKMFEEGLQREYFSGIAGEVVDYHKILDNLR